MSTPLESALNSLAALGEHFKDTAATAVRICGLLANQPQEEE